MFFTVNNVHAMGALTYTPPLTVLVNANHVLMVYSDPTAESGTVLVLVGGISISTGDPMDTVVTDIALAEK